MRFKSLYQIVSKYLFQHKINPTQSKLIQPKYELKPNQSYTDSNQSWNNYAKYNKLFQFIFIFFILFITSLTTIHAKEYHMTLLAVSEAGGDDVGMTADLYLTIKPGTGRIYIDTFPLTKIDTQISTRFANNIACNYLDLDCSNKDFFYTIRSNSVIIGGPSAGAALTLLTIAGLEGYNIDENIAVTGTINSGGLVGPVGGLSGKIRAGANKNLTTILIPRGEAIKTKEIKLNETNNITNQSLFENVTIDLIELGRENGVVVKEVSTIDDVLYEFTGKRKQTEDIEIVISKDYQDIMKKISIDLCNRSDELKSRINNTNHTLYLDSQNLSRRALEAISIEKYYSSASYCFGANLRLSNQLLIEENINEETLQKRINIHQNKIIELNKIYDDYSLQTITDLQTYEIVKERLIEADDYLKKSVEALQDHNLDHAIYQMSYAVERYNSAISWSNFFNAQDEKVNLDKEIIKKSCVEKLTEAEERYQYVLLYTPQYLSNTRRHLDRAYEDLENENYELCLFKASKAKAEADVILGALGVSEKQIDYYIDIKLNLVKEQIAKQQKKGYFPILGYSYYEYANNLKNYDKYSTLIYAEYALELSNLDLYFNNNSKKKNLNIDYNLAIMFILGILFGVFFSLLFFYRPKKSKTGIHITIKKRK